MRRDKVVLTEKHIGVLQRVTIGVALLALAAVAFSGLRLLSSNMQLRDLTERVSAQKKTLSGLRQALKKPRKPIDPDQAKIDAIARVQGYMERSCRQNGCQLGEFQAGLERGPYLSVFTLDTNKPGWEQVQVHVTLNGPAAGALHTIEGLKNSGVPVEPDSIEIVRGDVKIDKVMVSARVVFRVLIMSGGAS